METKLFDIPKDTKLKVSQDVVDGKINFSFEFVRFGVSKGDYVYAKAIDPDVTDKADCIYIVGDNDRVSSAFINLYKNKLYLVIESFHEEDYDIRYATQDEIDLLNNRLSDEGMYLDKETKTVKMYDNFECGDLVIAWNYEHLAIVGTLDDVDYSKEYRYKVGELGYMNAIQFNSIEQFKNKIK